VSSVSSVSLWFAFFSPQRTRRAQGHEFSGGTLAALDPADALPQLDNAFVVAIDRTPGTHVNPDPATIGMAEGPVCYDLTYIDGGVTRYNALHLRLSRPRTLLLHLDSTPRDVPSWRRSVGSA
jgi:hypothetical protein